MNTFTTKDGTLIYYKDWGSGPVITFSHGWPLSADAWDLQMLYGCNKPGAKISEGVRESFRMQGMQSSIIGSYDCIKAFADQTEDLKKIDVPTLVIQGDADQIVPL